MERDALEDQVESIAERLKGKMVVSLEEDDWRKMECKWALVLRLANGMQFNLTGLSNVLSRIWNAEERVTFLELANNMALAKFKHESDFKRIRDGGPWHCMESFVLMHEWCPDLAPEEFQMNRLGV
ncbi:hypothetical protein QQ045_007136 [Rhodiola kirilowii]